MIILVRHGEATHHTEHLTGGWTDSELTAAGKVQLQAVASKLAKDFAGQSRDLRILTSDLKRAEESAGSSPPGWGSVSWNRMNFCAKKITDRRQA